MHNYWYYLSLTGSARDTNSIHPLPTALSLFKLPTTIREKNTTKDIH